MIELIGYIAAALSTITFLPQLIKIMRTRTTRDISFGMLIILDCSNICWIIYGCLMNIKPVVFCNGLIFIQGILVFAFKLKIDGLKFNAER